MTTDIFERHPNLQRVYQTADGTNFYEEGDARNHARSLKNKEVKTVERGSESKKKSSDKESKISAFQSAKSRIEAINELNTVEEIEQALEEETAKTVLKAGADRIATIQALEENKKDK